MKDECHFIVVWGRPGTAITALSNITKLPTITESFSAHFVKKYNHFFKKLNDSVEMFFFI